VSPPALPRTIVRACILTGVAGILTLTTAIATTTNAWRSPALFLCFTVALVVLHFIPVRLTHEGELEGMQLEEAFFVPVALLLSPAETLLAFAIAETFGHVWKRRGTVKLLFNGGQVVTTAGLALAVSRLLGAATGTVDLRGILAAVAGGFVFPALGALAVAGIISQVQGVAFRRVLVDGLGIRAAMWVGSLSLGVLVILATHEHPWALPVVLAPVVVVQLAYAGARAQWRERRRLQALHDAATSIRSSVDVAQVQGHVLEAARMNLEAASARIVGIDTPRPEHAMRAAIDRRVALEVAGRVGGGAWDDTDAAHLHALAGVAAAALQVASLFDTVTIERQKLADVVGSTSDGIFTVDDEDRIVSWNPAMAAITGYAGDAALGRSPSALLVPPESCDEVGGLAITPSCVTPFGEGHEPRVVRIRTASDASRWITVTRSPLPDGGAVIVARDETAKAEVDDLKADFLATISHELRTPLTPIKGYLTMLLNDTIPMTPEQQQRFLVVMERQTTRLERLIGDLLDATSLSSDRLYLPEDVHWHNAALSVASISRAQFPDHTVDIEIDDDLHVLADEHRAEQILGNLLSNACKYSPTGTTVRVTAEVIDGMVRTTVADEGPGIARAHRERIFERFTRLGDHMRRTVGGAGLGLYIARQLVEAMGGRIWVDGGDGAGGGAAFSFTLPLGEAERRPPVRRTQTTL
jgi:PAS domain S-box-containing protein